jgi:hypothetical protein
MPIPIGSFHINGKILYPSKEYFRYMGELHGISYDDDMNMYEVCYDEYDGECIAYSAELIEESESDDK